MTIQSLLAQADAAIEQDECKCCACARAASLALAVKELVGRVQVAEKALATIVDDAPKTDPYDGDRPEGNSGDSETWGGDYRHFYLAKGAAAALAALRAPLPGGGEAP